MNSRGKRTIVISILVAVIVIVAVVLALNNQFSFQRTETLFIYNGDGIDYTLDTLSQIHISGDLNLHEKLQIVADSLSERAFKGLPIDVLSIDTLDDKTIATVNLDEFEGENFNAMKFRGPKWLGGYFEGSTGGWCTSIAVSFTLLQPDYQGDWIDGINVLYRNKQPNTDHFGIGDNSLRENLKYEQWGW